MESVGAAKSLTSLGPHQYANIVNYMVHYIVHYKVHCMVHYMVHHMVHCIPKSLYILYYFTTLRLYYYVTKVRYCRKRLPRATVLLYYFTTLLLYYYVTKVRYRRKRLPRAAAAGGGAAEPVHRRVRRDTSV